MTQITLCEGDNRDHLRRLIDEGVRVHSVVTDPPYGISFMGKAWDGTQIERDPEFWKLILEILLPGGYCFAFSGSRTGHWQACAMEMAGFVMHPMHGWCFGCLDTETLAATPDGDKPYTELSPGDEVICYDPATAEYSVQPILEVVEYDYEDTAYRLIGDHGEQVVSRNHRCIVERGGSEVFHFAETLEQQEVIPVLEDLRGLREALLLQGFESHTQPGLLQSVQGGSALAGPRPDAFSDGRTQGETRRLPSLLDANLETGRLAAEDSGDSVLQPIVSREGNRAEAACPALTQRTLRLDGCQRGVFSCENDRREEPLLEGRRDPSQQERQSRSPANQVCALSAASEQHVSQGRLCDGASDRSSEGDGKAAAALGGGASHQPRRDGQQDHQPDAVRDQCGTQTVRAWTGHKTDLVRVVPFQYVGKVWCLRVPTGAFVAVRNGVAFPTGNSGFPKAHAADKAIDKMLGVERQVVGQSDRGSGAQKNKLNNHGVGDTGIGYADGSGKIFDLTISGSPEAAEWEGWAYGTQAQKPALEPIYLGQKPFSEKTGAANLLKHGVGAVNIDGCRVPAPDGVPVFNQKGQSAVTCYGDGLHGSQRTGAMDTNTGRHPANLILDGSPEVVAMFPDSKGQHGAVKGDEPSRTGDDNTHCYGKFNGRVPAPVRGDSGSAARFFHQFGPDTDPLIYHGKANKHDRAGSKHPTVKPVALMAYLVRHITPPGGVVLDPFAGSGTMGEAARREGFDCILMEQEPEHIEFLKQRFALEDEDELEALLA